jgi:hypothetical protein
MNQDERNDLRARHHIEVEPEDINGINASCGTCNTFDGVACHAIRALDDADDLAARLELFTEFFDGVETAALSRETPISVMFEIERLIEKVKSSDIEPPALSPEAIADPAAEHLMSRTLGTKALSGKRIEHASRQGEAMTDHRQTRAHLSRIEELLLDLVYQRFSERWRAATADSEADDDFSRGWRSAWNEAMGDVENIILTQIESNEARMNR